jgi:hypothetical protein
MNIYLDIDGTMIHEDLSDRYGKPAEGLEAFIIALRPFDTYWLTTHCRNGDPARAREIMKRVLPDELHADIDRIRPTVWTDLKTEGIDFGTEFIWFDNDIHAAEWGRLKECSEAQMAIEVDLRKNPRHLIEITRDILAS